MESGTRVFSTTTRYVLLFLMAVVCLPFLWLGLYNVPIGMHEWDWMTREAGTLPARWLDIQQVIYVDVMGRFSSNAVLSTTHLWCTPSNFGYFFLLWQLTWGITLYFLIKALFQPHSPFLTLLMAFCLQVMYLTHLEDVYDSLFRYTGVLTYQSGFLLASWAVICFVQYLRQNSKPSWLRWIGILLLILCVGTNEISMVLCFASVTVIFIYGKLTKLRTSLFQWWDLVILAISCGIVILAPGNGERIVSEHGTLPLLKWSWTTLGASTFLWTDWLSDSLLIPITILAMPVLNSHFLQTDRINLFKDYRPWLWSLVIAVPLNMGMLLYATGTNAFPERVLDHLFVHVIVIWFGCLYAMALKFNFGHWMTKQPVGLVFKTGYYLCAIFIVIHIFGKGLSVDRTNKHHSGDYLALIETQSNVSAAWMALLSGSAATYYTQSMVELKKLESCASDTCYMIKPRVIPTQLYDPLSDRRNRGGDPYLGYYYNKAIQRVLYKPE